MKKRLFILIVSLLLAPSLANAQTIINGARAFPQLNDTSTGTTLNGTAIINSAGHALNAGITDTGIPTYIVVNRAGKTGNAGLGIAGIALCTMDSTIASSAGGYYVVNSTTTPTECHAQSAAPSSGTWVIGYLSSSATSIGATALVQLNGYLYTAAGGAGASLTLSNLTSPTAINLSTLTFAGAAGITAGGSNQNITLTPSGIGVVSAAGGSLLVAPSAVYGGDSASANARVKSGLDVLGQAGVNGGDAVLWLRTATGNVQFLYFVDDAAGWGVYDAVAGKQPLAVAPASPDFTLYIRPAGLSVNTLAAAAANYLCYNTTADVGYNTLSTCSTLPANLLPNPSASTLGGVESLAVVAKKWINTISTSGVPAATQPACGDLSDSASGCSTAAYVLPNPSASTLGGTESLAVVAHKWINTISTSGVPAATQPACGDLSDSASGCSTAAYVLPNPSASTLGGTESLAVVAHKWINTISTSGVPAATQPAFSDVSGAATAAQIPNGLVHFNTSAATPGGNSGTYYYIPNSDVDLPATYIMGVGSGTTFRWYFVMGKTAAGTAAFNIRFLYGTAGTTGDTTIATQSVGTATAVADQLTCDATLAFTSATAAFWSLSCAHIAATGVGFGLLTTAVNVWTGTVSGLTTSTPSLKFGLAYMNTTGTAVITTYQTWGKAFNLD